MGNEKRLINVPGEQTMLYRETVFLKDGRKCILRNGTVADGPAALDNFIMTHGQTDFLLTYPEENRMTVEQEAQYLKTKAESTDEIEILAEVDGKIVGTAGVDRIGVMEKIRHRAEFGISIDKEYWGLGIGKALTKACIACAKMAGYVQLELQVVADNKSAAALYESLGFLEYGRNPKGFLSRTAGWQELVMMRMELTREENAGRSV